MGEGLTRSLLVTNILSLLCSPGTYYHKIRLQWAPATPVIMAHGTPDLFQFNLFD